MRVSFFLNKKTQKYKGKKGSTEESSQDYAQLRGMWQMFTFGKRNVKVPRHPDIVPERHFTSDMLHDVFNMGGVDDNFAASVASTPNIQTHPARCKIRIERLKSTVLHLDHQEQLVTVLLTRISQ